MKFTQQFRGGLVKFETPNGSSTEIADEDAERIQTVQGVVDSLYGQEIED